MALLWPADVASPNHTLLVDGIAVPGGAEGELVVTPTSAILHRVRAGRGAPAAGSGPSA